MLWRVPLLVFLAGGALALAPQAPAAAASGRIVFTVDGVERSAFLVEKARLRRKTRPVIILLQDAARNAPIWRRALRFERFAENGGIFVHAEPLDGVWTFSAADGAAREIAYLRRLVEEVASNALADRSRVYLVGVGSGGAVALQAVCGAGGYAGVAAILTSLSPDALEACRPAKPIPALFIAGAADKRVPIDGGMGDLPGYAGPLASVEAVANVFAKASACAPRRVRSELPDRDRGDGSRVVAESFSGCAEPVRLLRIVGGGHVPPVRAAGARIQGQNRDVSTSRTVLTFFKLPGG